MLDTPDFYLFGLFWLLFLPTLLGFNRFAPGCCSCYTSDICPNDCPTDQLIDTGTISVVISGLGDQDCDQCNEANGTYVLDYDQVGDSCSYKYLFTGTCCVPCPDPGSQLSMHQTGVRLLPLASVSRADVLLSFQAFSGTTCSGASAPTEAGVARWRKTGGPFECNDDLNGTYAWESTTTNLCNADTHFSCSYTRCNGCAGSTATVTA